MSQFNVPGVLDYWYMPIEHIIVDGSNIATEGRSLPSLAQLEQAVAELHRDHPDGEVTVIVDATFAHRIDPSELSRFEAAALKGEYVHPPAGAIGRGDAFLLRVAQKIDATVLSNDSFQEFHGEHPWLFDRGRLLGATPVPGIGWIFSPRQPVRGPRSRQAVRETDQAKKRVTKAIAVATKEVVEPVPERQSTRSSARGAARGAEVAVDAADKVASGRPPLSKPTPKAVNDPLAFISFVAEHRLGEQFEGEVEGYTSHGAVVRVGEMRCYVPLANLGDPAPRSAREVLKRKQLCVFVLTALDPQRRGAELALPGVARVSGHPREETVAAEVRLANPPRRRRGVSSSKEDQLSAKSPETKAAATGKELAGTGVTKAVARKAPARKAAVSKAPARKAVATKAPATKAVARKAPARKAAAAKTATRKPAPAKSSPVKVAPVKAAAAKPASTRARATKAVATKSPKKKAVAPKAGAQGAAVSKSRAKSSAVTAKSPVPASSARRSPLTKARAK
jgi:hypothetical protein